METEISSTSQRQWQYHNFSFKVEKQKGGSVLHKKENNWSSFTRMITKLKWSLRASQQFNYISVAHSLACSRRWLADTFFSLLKPTLPPHLCSHMTSLLSFSLRKQKQLKKILTTSTDILLCVPLLSSIPPVALDKLSASELRPSPPLVR